MDSNNAEKEVPANSWRMKAVVIGTTTMTGSFVLINPNVIHGLFGSVERKDQYHVYTLNTKHIIGESTELSIDGSFHATFDGVMAEIARRQAKRSNLTDFWIYLPDRKYILYLEGLKFLCLDYAHFNEGNTLCIEINGLRDPLHDAIELNTAIKSAHRMIIETTNIYKQYNGSDPSKCSFCSKQSSDINEGDSKLLVCSRCKLAYYCNRACQGKHWPTHKTTCTPIVMVETGAPSPASPNE